MFFTELQDEIQANASRFGLDTTRQYEGSAHRQVTDVLLRGPDYGAEGATLQSLHHELECFDYEELDLFPEVMGTVQDIVSDNVVGRVILAKLAPDGIIFPHKDEGPVPEFYTRCHYVIQGESTFIIDGHEQVMKEKELWIVNVLNEHSVINHGTIDRIHLIVDVHATTPTT